MSGTFNDSKWQHLTSESRKSVNGVEVSSFRRNAQPVTVVSDVRNWLTKSVSDMKEKVLPKLKFSNSSMKKLMQKLV